MSKPLIVFVVGSTASGKSDLAISIAKKLKGTIVNGDSLQVYSSLSIGTAKPTDEEMGQVPHRLFGHIENGKAYTAGDYRREALELFAKEPEGAPWVIVGGSGFYLQALEKGMFPVPDIPDVIRQRFEQRLKEEGLESLYAELQLKDSLWAKKIDAKDSYRVIRALMVMEVKGQTMTMIEKEFVESESNLHNKFHILKLGVNQDREILRERVRKRLGLMHQAGWEQEVKGLIDLGLKDWAPMNSVGYKEMVAFLSGEVSAIDRDEEIVKNTMRLAKRQRTWFKRDTEINWFVGGEESDRAVAWLIENLQG